MDFYTQVNQNRKILSLNENNILEYLIKNGRTLHLMTIRKIAQANFVAPNSVVRVCQKLGFNSFSLFREALALSFKDKSEPVPLNHLDEQINKTKQINSTITINSVVDALKKCTKVNLFAAGLSKLVADEMFYKLNILDIPAQVYNDIDVIEHSVPKFKDTEIAFFISNSGKTVECLRAAYLASYTDAFTVSITGFANNQLSNLTQYQLYGMVDDLQINNIDISSRLTLYYITNLLIHQYIEGNEIV